MREFSSAVLPAPSSYHTASKMAAGESREMKEGNQEATGWSGLSGKLPLKWSVCMCAYVAACWKG